MVRISVNFIKTPKIKNKTCLTAEKYMLYLIYAHIDEHPSVVSRSGNPRKLLSENWKTAANMAAADVVMEKISGEKLYFFNRKRQLEEPQPNANISLLPPSLVLLPLTLLQEGASYICQVSHRADNLENPCIRLAVPKFYKISNDEHSKGVLSFIIDMNVFEEIQKHYLEGITLDSLLNYNHVASPALTWLKAVRLAHSWEYALNGYDGFFNLKEALELFGLDLGDVPLVKGTPQSSSLALVPSNNSLGMYIDPVFLKMKIAELLAAAKDMALLVLQDAMQHIPQSLFNLG